MKKKTFILVRRGLRYFVYNDEPNWHKHNCLEVFYYLYSALDYINKNNANIKHKTWSYSYEPKI